LGERDAVHGILSRQSLAISYEIATVAGLVTRASGHDDYLIVNNSVEKFSRGKRRKFTRRVAH
jgi:hypothetical protein